MFLTQEFIEEEMISFFNPFAYNAVKYDKSKGGFDVQLIEESKLKFIIFDLKWEDEDKKEIWSETVDCKDFKNPIDLKIQCAKKIEPSVLRFCQNA